MKDPKSRNDISRKEFNRLIVTAATALPMLGPGKQSARSAQNDESADHRNERESMTYRRLGRTNFMSSRLVFGCGAALAGGKAVRLLDRAFEAGINHFDVGSDVYYKGSERSLAPFYKAKRDQIWVTSKAPVSSVNIKPDDPITPEMAKTAAKFWTKLLHGSLGDLQTDYIDAYYLMAVNNAELVKCEEMYKAFVEAKAAGKVGCFGLSTHKNANNVMRAAIETGWYDIAMVGITPAGWYDWTTKELEKETPTLTELRPLFDQARAVGMGLIGMKAVRYLAPMKSLGKDDPSAFDDIYETKLKSSSLNPFQRSYAYVLEHGIDVVNADMQNFKHLEENILAAATSFRFFG